MLTSSSNHGRLKSGHLTTAELKALENLKIYGHASAKIFGQFLSKVLLLYATSDPGKVLPIDVEEADLLVLIQKLLMVIELE